jgi:hypothetical protein
MCQISSPLHIPFSELRLDQVAALDLTSLQVIGSLRGGSHRLAARRQSSARRVAAVALRLAARPAGGGGVSASSAAAAALRLAARRPGRQRFGSPHGGGGGASAAALRPWIPGLGPPGFVFCGTWTAGIPQKTKQPYPFRAAASDSQPASLPQ